MEIDEKLRVGAAGEITTTATNKFGLRGGKVGSRTRLQGVTLDTSSAFTLVDQLAKALQQKWLRARDLFLVSVWRIWGMCPGSSRLSLSLSLHARV